MGDETKTERTAAEERADVVAFLYAQSRDTACNEDDAAFANILAEVIECGGHKGAADRQRRVHLLVDTMVSLGNLFRSLDDRQLAIPGAE